MSVLRRLENGWLTVMARFGGVQTLVLLAFFYIFLVGPAASLTRLGGRDFLEKRSLDRGKSAWRDADTHAPDLERAKLQT